jgi:putative permease
LLPQLYNQTRELITELPLMLAEAQTALLTLPVKYPELFTETQIKEMVTTLRDDMAEIGKSVLTWSLSSVVGAITLLVYLILVPLLVFFFMKDKGMIILWLGRYLPRDRALLDVVWVDVDRQIGNYIRGKFIEIFIIWLVCLITFVWFGLNFAMLLAVLVGLSVIIPYIGASVVTLPVAAVAYFQWGLTSDFYWVLASYLVIQALDGNALVPLLFSEVVNLHPIAIIVAILVFGGLWGFWGVFFAIPLATLVQAVLKAWPDTERPIA